MEGYESFKTKIYQFTGINLSSYKERQMKRRIESLISRNKFSGYESYFSELKKNKDLLEEFINYLTINVSEFRRNPQQWDVLEKDIMPSILQKSKKPKIWSAACSTGEEPYTLVMLMNKFMPLSEIEIHATDIDSGALEKADIGMYNEKATKNLPPDDVKRFFLRNGDFYQIKKEVKDQVKFKKHNLLEDKYPDNCDLIICRNVMIYFTEDTKSVMYHKFHDALKPGGVLFVGSTEQIIMPNRYKLTPLKTFFYQKK
ncbi:MAG: protein-glutamate O-methyltransferase CheR [Tindallia sp. MSAO_Bac2]|nr:MAG: protein-glutamate O-methyltransferase CheR [Tindallia sp. MSAO_Bac2]